MKSTIGAAATSMFCGGFSMAMATPHPMLSNVAALVGIVAGIVTTLSLLVNIRKTNKEARIVDLEITHLVLQRCKECTAPEDCAFTGEAKPSFCHYKKKELPPNADPGMDSTAGQGEGA